MIVVSLIVFFKQSLRISARFLVAVLVYKINDGAANVLITDLKQTTANNKRQCRLRIKATPCFKTVQNIRTRYDKT